jgi:hypothetical protein
MMNLQGLLLQGRFSDFRKTPLFLGSLFLLLPVLPLLGCYGEFALTKSLYEFNGNIDPNGFIQSVVMWVLSFFFIYSVAVLVDVAILNLIEFWTGDNPMLAQATYDNPDGSQVVMTPSPQGNEVKIDLKKDGKTVETRRVVKADDTHFKVYTADGSLVGSVAREANGNLVCSRPGTTQSAVLTSEMIAQFTTQAASGMSAGR